MANETFTVTEAIALAPAGDTDLDGVIDPGETVRITVHITNNSANPGATVATGLEFSQILNGMTLVNQAGNDVNVSPVAFDDSYTAIGNTLLEVGSATAQTGPQSSVAGHVTDNDLEFFGDTFEISAFQSTSANGGTVTMVTSGADMGSFTYVSAAGFTGADSFTYTIRDKGLDGIAGNADDLVNTATVNVTVNNQVWYVDSSFGGVSNGTSTNPYTSLAAVSGAAGGDGDGDIIYVDTGAGNYTGGVTLLNDQTLHGAGSDLVVGGFTLATADTDAVITNAAGNGVTLASGNTLTGFTVGDTTGFDIANTNTASVGNLTVSNVVLNGSGGLFRADSGGTLNVTLESASTSNAGASGILLGNVDNSSFTVSGTTTINDATADGIAVSNSQNSAFTFGGKVTVLNDAGGANGDGVDLQSNNSADSTFNFNGGVDITVNGTNAFGFRAQSSGVVNILDPGGNNQITSNNGTALFINPTQFNAALNSVTAGDGGTGDGIHLEGVTGTGVTIATASITGVGGDGVEILNSSANIAINGGTIGAGNDAAGDGVNVTGGTGGVSIAASITKTTAGNIVEVNNHETGNVTFSGTLSATGGVNNGIFVTDSNSGTIAFTSAATKVLSTGANAGVSLTNNTGGTINFQNGALDIDTTGGTGFNATGGGTIGVSSAGSTITATTGSAVNLNAVTASFTGGGLDIDTTSGTGFAAAGGGTVAVTGTGNSVNATSGAALSVNGTTIGASDMTFQRIDSGAGANVGISLINTGTSGGLKVTGSGAAGSGGTITGKTGADGSTTAGIGIYLENTSEVSLERMTLTNFDNHGIFGKSVNGIRVLNSTIGGTIGTSSGSNDAAVAFGTTSPSLSNGFANGSSSLFDGVDISGGIEHNFEVYQDSGTFNLTIQNSSIHDNSAALGGDGLLIETTGSAHGIMRVATTDFDDNKSQALQANALGSSHLEITLHDNDISRTTQGNEGFILQNGANGDLTAAITNNVFGGTSGGNILGTNIFVGNVVNNASSSAFLNATISGNTITQTGGGVNRTLIAFFSSNVGSTAQSQSKVRIDGNTLTSDLGSEPIFVSTPDPNTAPLFHATVTNNVVVLTDNVNAIRGIAVQATQGVAGQGATGFAQIAGNDIQRPNGTPPGINDIRARQANPGGGATNPTLTLDPATSASTVPNTVLTQDNPLSTTEVAGTVTVVNGTIQTPSTPATPSLPGFLTAGDPFPENEPVSDQPAGGGPADEPASPTPDGESSTGDPPASDLPPAPDASVIVDDGYLSRAELDFFVDAAMQRWIATGLTAEQIAALEALAFDIVAMPGLELGSFDNGAVSIDSDGAGRGWFADATPLEDGEFANVVAATQLTAVSGTAAAGRFDLLTTIMHEMGHALGLGDLLDPASRANLLYGYLFAGERRLPGNEADGATPGSVTHEAFAGSLIQVVPDDGTSVLQDNLFNLPPGRTVDIQWDATIDSQTNQLIVNPTNSGTVTATNGVGFGDVTSNIVTTTLDTLTLGGIVWNDNGAGGGTAGNGALEGTEPGINSVALTLFADTGTTAGVWDASDTAIATTATAGGGLYSFTGLAPGSYIVGVDLANFSGGGALAALPGSSVTAPEPIDPDNDVDNDDNGARAAGQAAYSAAISLAYGTETHLDGTGRLDVNNTLDLAFRATDQEPTLTATGLSPTYTEGDAAVDLFSGVTASTVDAGQTFTSMTLTVSNVTDGANEILGMDGSNVALTNGNAVTTATSGLNVTVSLAAGLATVTFSGATLSAAALQTVIDGLTYRNTSDNPTDADRVVTITQLVDSGLGTAPDDNTLTTSIASTVNVNPVNDAATITGTSTGDVTEAGGVANGTPGTPTATGDLNATDPDNAADAWQVVAPGGLTSNGYGTYELSAAGVWTYTLDDSNAAVQALNGAATLTDIFTASTVDGTTQMVTVTIHAQNDAPVLTAQDTTVSGTEDANLVFSAANANALTVADVDDASLEVTLTVVNGVLTLSQTTGLAFGAGDGTGDATMTFSGTAADINAALEGLIYRGNLNYEGADTLAVTVDDGDDTDSDNVAITLADDGVIDGTAGNDVLTGTALVDVFDLSGGGNDTAIGLASNDGFYMGAALSALDILDGGAGTDDQLGLQGNYGAPFVLAASHLTNIETLVLLPGNDTRFGDTAGNFYSYNIATIDANVGLGQRLTVNFNTLRVGENVIFDGSLESDGWFLTYGGLGNDTITGGAQNDGFYFGNNARWGAGDSVNGGAGDDQLGLQGSYTVIFGVGQLAGVETIALLTGGDSRFGNPPGVGYSYDLTMDDDNVGNLETMIINANTLRAGVPGVSDETLTFDGSAEIDGRFTIYSGAGNDTLIGGDNDDTIYGAAGADTMTGGTGNDTFAYMNAAHSTALAMDQVLDFALGDKINLASIDAVAGGANDAFTFIGAAAFSNTAGELRAVDLGGGSWQIEGDIDGVGGADLVIAITSGHALTVTDLTL